MNKLENIALSIRKRTLELAFKTKSGHLGSALSVIDLLTALYFHYLNVDPKKYKKINRDRFILSKGHSANALYVTLCRRGFFKENVLNTYLANESFLGAHPSAQGIPGIDFATGSLGHGLSVGVGMALGAKLNKEKYRVVVVLSDGECDEGSIWEAAMSAAHLKLDNLLVIVDYNKIQAFGKTKDVMNLEPFSSKWKAFGFSVQEVDGHDMSKIISALHKIPLKKQLPNIIIAHTVKGYGVSFMENQVASHYQVLNDEQYKKAVKELS